MFKDNPALCERVIKLKKNVKLIGPAFCEDWLVILQANNSLYKELHADFSHVLNFAKLYSIT